MDLRAKAKKQQATVPPSQALSEFLAALRYEDLPQDVVARTKELFVDWFASVLAGKGARPVQVMEKFTARMGPASGPSEVLTSRMRTSPVFAALVPCPINSMTYSLTQLRRAFARAPGFSREAPGGHDG